MCFFSRRDHRGNTSLHLSVLMGFDDISQILIDNNADVKAKNSEGWTCYDECLATSNRFLAEQMYVFCIKHIKMYQAHQKYIKKHQTMHTLYMLRKIENQRKKCIFFRPNNASKTKSKCLDMYQKMHQAHQTVHQAHHICIKNIKPCIKNIKPYIKRIKHNIKKYNFYRIRHFETVVRAKFERRALELQKSLSTVL